MKVHGISEKQREDIVRLLKPLVLYGFGSRVTGRARDGSDLDLAFLSRERVDPVKRFELANRLADALGFTVDLVDLAEASTVFSKEVLRTGVALEVADEAVRRQFEMKTLADYAKLNEERRPVLEIWS
ncbi:type VII toxin-antitoxin system MntA family adenylyltransferase antitoxin [Haloferula sargassicola]|uniref:Polymerase beta nucleotidyltransferase domain-containing protein n=1 Tax=Haloferula sargassicola TaxID=490096 RepID=A0ABP9UUI7_9BACT